jgi:hypothetical protein
MAGYPKDDAQPFPPRPLRPDERTLVAVWLAAAGDVASAYVSERSSDDQGIYRRVVITVLGDEPTHLIDAPTGTDYWIVLQCRPDQDVHTFRSLREALNSVRPVLHPVAGPAADREA